MAGWAPLLAALLSGEDLSTADTAWAMREVMSGEATPAQVAGFVVALRAKGETPQEVAGLVEVMLDEAAEVAVPGRVVDTCGTGGDRAGTVNISTMAALVVAGAGVPVAPGYGFDDTRRWVEKVSRAVGATVPDLVSWEWHRERRRGLARLDYTQNAINKTLVAPFSARPAPGAPVSVPIRWEELDDPDLRSGRWTLRTVAARVAEAGDPLAPLVGRAQRLPDL